MELSDQGSSLNFESCASSINEDFLDDQDTSLNFFRDRSSSDSVAVMGNKSSSSGSKAQKRQAAAAFAALNSDSNPRPETETNSMPPAVQQLVNDNSSSAAKRTTNGSSSIGKSNTTETIFRDISDADEQQQADPSTRSSYKDVAHHHLFSCEDIICVFPDAQEDDSGSINAPELPLDGVDESLKEGACRLDDNATESSEVFENGDQLQILPNSVQEEIGPQQQPLVEPHSRSLQLEQLREVATENKEQNQPCPSNSPTKTWTVELGHLSKLNFLALEVPWKLHTATAAPATIICRGRLRTVSL